MVDIGDIPPNATVKLTTNDKISETLELKEIYHDDGFAILHFFPAIFTGVCTKSSCQLREDKNEFENLKANLFGISVDLPFSQARFIEEYQINYPILSDWNREAINAFDIVDEKFGGYFNDVSKRALFAIKDNRIIYKWIADNPGQYPPFDDLKDAITEY